jgi:lysine 2,3-aminomutase
LECANAGAGCRNATAEGEWGVTERWTEPDSFHAQTFLAEAREILDSVQMVTDLESARWALYERVARIHFEKAGGLGDLSATERNLVRDCAHAMRSMLHRRSAKVSGFDLAGALWDAHRGRERSELGPGFWAEMINLCRGLLGRAPRLTLTEDDVFRKLEGRKAAVKRSEELDRMWDRLESHTARYEDGLVPAAVERRRARREKIMAALGGDEARWADWRWHRDNVAVTGEALSRLVPVTAEQEELVRRSREGRLPFGVTPYYASLADDEPSSRDLAVRAQVLPPRHYVEAMLEHAGERGSAFDFMGEHDTSPVDLVTRRYPAVVILKPYNTCPQICVYCQRNWEIEEALDCNALASEEDVETAVRWIESHPAVREVLVTGGDPLALDDDQIMSVLERLARIERLDLIRIGSRTPVTMPMRITEQLAARLGALRQPGRRELCVVTHFENVYEITPEATAAVDRLKRNGIGVYNQQVYTFFVSRRYEAVALRMLLRRIGVDPYYTFVPKGKVEMSDYLVPVARLLQERSEEARLLPGIKRTDEPVFNVPRLGKNHVRAAQNRDLLAVLPNGARVYDFHPWEKNIVDRSPYAFEDTPILDYLLRLERFGEDPEQYRSIWYYF